MKKYCEKYDAHFDSKTGKWLEEGCGGKDCPYCYNRPKLHKPHNWEFMTKKGVCK